MFVIARHCEKNRRFFVAIQFIRISCSFIVKLNKVSGLPRRATALLIMMSSTIYILRTKKRREFISASLNIYTNNL